MLRILDSRRENFKLSKAYVDKIKVINIITAPEIEMLVIFHEGRYTEFKISGKKPSIYCKENLRYSNVKSQAFIAEYFSNIDDLIEAIMEYKRVSNVPRDELTLADLLRES